MGKLRDKHKLFVDRLFLNDFNRGEAYLSVYPNISPKYAAKMGYRLLQRQEVKDYYDYKLEEYKQKMNASKEKMIERKMKIENLFMEYLELIQKEKLTPKEEKKFGRMYQLFGRVDINKVSDIINKLQGNYEPEKHEHSGSLPININLIQPDKEDDDDEEPGE